MTKLELIIIGISALAVYKVLRPNQGVTRLSGSDSGPIPENSPVVSDDIGLMRAGWSKFSDWITFTRAVLVMIGILIAVLISILIWAPAGTISAHMEAPSLPRVTVFVEEYWLWVGILLLVLLVASFFAPKGYEKGGAGARTVLVWLGVALLALVLWKSSNVSSLFDKVNTVALQHEAHGDTQRFKGSGGQVAKFEGQSFIAYCVYKNGVVEVELPPRRCDWGRLDYQFAHDTSGVPHSIRLRWVRQP